MITMKGSLVTLEPLDVNKHAKGYFLVSQDEKVHTYLGNQVPNSAGEIVSLLKKYEQYFINWMIVANDTNEVIGIIRLSKPYKEKGLLMAGESEMLCSKYWRKGHMKETKKLFYNYVFNELLVDVLYADVWEGNINSMKSLESYGYQLVEITNEIFSKTGKYMKKYMYSLKKTDYVNKY